MFLSDTVVVAVVPKTLDRMHEVIRSHTTEEDLAAAAVAYASTISGYVYRQGLFTPPSWAYRGCIAYGDFYLDDRFLVGEAVDEAAGGMDIADGAFVWLAESAKNSLERTRVSFGGGCTPLTRYKVPRKTHRGDAEATIDTFVASPFEWQPTVEHAESVVDALLRTFEVGNDERVARKETNTRAFLEHHLNELKQEHAEFERLYGRLARWT